MAPSRRGRTLAGSCALAIVGLLAVAPPASAASGTFFRVAHEQDRFWLVDPEGRRFFSTGVNLFHAGDPPAEFDPGNPSYSALREHPSFEAWYSLASRRLSDWGFNTLGSWSAPEVVARGERPYTLSLHLGQWVGAPWVDVADPDSLATIRALIADEVRPHREDPRLIGYFVDNELCWCESSLFTYWAKRPAGQRMKRKLFELLRAEYHGELAAFLRDFSAEPRPRHFDGLAGALREVAVRPGRRPPVIEAFVELLADDYYGAVADAVRAADPNHLLLGDRFGSFYSQAAARACARHMDVVSVNYSPPARSGWISPSFFDTLHRLTGKPILVSEFYAAAMENRSGNRNRHGPYLVVDTQQQRADAVAAISEGLARLPYVVGYHWFQWSDQPSSGRFDGEDFNMGLVDLRDRPYEELTAAFARANAAVTEWHQAGPGPLGLAALDGLWAVPAAAREITLDGRLDEWSLARQWAPGVAARPPYLPFGDVFVAWEPAGLVVGLAYYDYSASPVDRTNPQSRSRLVLSFGRDGRPAARVVLFGLDEREGGAGTPLARLGPLGGGRKPQPSGAQQGRNLLTTAEVLLPAQALGLDRLRPGDRLKLALVLALQGERKQIRWPGTDAEAAIVLEPAKTAAETGR